MTTEQNDSQKRLIKILGIVVAVAALVAIVLFAVARNASAPEATEVPTEEASQDTSWSDVESAGVLRVGTAADNPPFSYLDESYVISGFDASLIRLVGERLGVAVEITDFAFNGLQGALQVNQVDAVIAAISVTPQREAVMDFSNVYYFGKEGVLVRNESPIERVITLDQFKGMRIGVQRLSIYEKWLREELVDTGKLPAENLLIYAKPEHAVRDLSTDFLDVVVLDEQNAAMLSSTIGVRFVESGLFPQRFAIAVNTDATALQNKINQALTELQNDGTLNNLKGTYLGHLPEMGVPTATPPTVTPTPEANCVDAMEFVSDLNLDDQNLTYFHDFRPNEAFQKGWRIRNNGTCTWTISYSARYVYGTTSQADMSGQPTALNRAVAPGETYDLYVNLVAPGANALGRHVGYWQMFNSEGDAFGQSIWVAINVIAGNTATPPPQLTVFPTAQPTLMPTVKPTSEPTAKPTPIPSPTPDPGEEIKNETWYLVKYYKDSDLVKTLPGTKLNIELESNNQLSGNAGCNAITGKYQMSGNSISFSGISSGMIFCQKPEGIMDQEGHVIELLQYTTEWRLKDGYLELLRRKNKELEVLLTFTDKQPR